MSACFRLSFAFSNLRTSAYIIQRVAPSEESWLTWATSCSGESAAFSAFSTVTADAGSTKEDLSEPGGLPDVIAVRPS
jgi:hypothetical protein